MVLTKNLFFFDDFFDDIVYCNECDECEDDVAYFVRIFVDEVHVIAYDVAYYGKDNVPNACTEGCESDEWDERHAS